MSELVRDQPQIKTRVAQRVHDALRADAQEFKRSVSASVAYILEQWSDARDNQK